MFEQTGLLLRGVCEFCFYDLLERLLRICTILHKGSFVLFVSNHVPIQVFFFCKRNFWQVGAITELLYTRFMLLLSGWDDKFFK